MKKSILYIMGIDWEWIYQRPQIFAEMLSEDYHVTVLFPRSVTTRNKNLPDVPGIDFRILWTLPYQEKNELIYKMSKLLNRNVLRDIGSFDYIYVGYPLYARYIPEEYKGKIIYDCMDNHEALYPDQKRVHKVVREEEALIRRANLVVASSELLQKKIGLVAKDSGSVLIRNGVKIHDICDMKKPVSKPKYTLCYIGTISEWFDYEVVGKSLVEMDNIEYHLIGPVNKKVENKGIKYLGVMPQSELGTAVSEYDCLIMPFVVNDIVASVDPVKLYEYIAFGKCIVSVYYPEIARFEEFVYFYETHEEYVNLIKELSAKGFQAKYNKEQQINFLDKNTWKQRYEMLSATIKMS